MEIKLCCKKKMGAPGCIFLIYIDGIKKHFYDSMCEVNNSDIRSLIEAGIIIPDSNWPIDCELNDPLDCEDL